VAIYKESVTGSPLLYLSKHGKSEEGGPLRDTPVMAPYPRLAGMQQKRLAARRHKTTYCYDFPSVFGTALRDIWTARAVSGEPGSMPQGRLHSMNSSNPRNLLPGFFQILQDIQSGFGRAGVLFNKAGFIPGVNQIN
jgi:hypothetical protein